jgi:DNA-binding transcriptional regulator YdaS (Cro superfamily)
MKSLTLHEYLANEGTQETLAKALGVQQTAVSQMRRSKREITVHISDKGVISATEVRQIPARPKAPQTNKDD